MTIMIQDLSLKSDPYLEAPYFQFMQKICHSLESNEGYTLYLEPEALKHFDCSLCAECCQRPWLIQLSREYYEKWYDVFHNHPSGQFKTPFLTHTQPTDNNYAEMMRKPGTSECLFLQDDRTCFIHSNYGEEALSDTCKRYPRYEGWFGSYLAKFLLNSCPDTSQLIQEYPRIHYRIYQAKSDAQKSLNDAQHPLGIHSGLLWLGYQMDLADKKVWSPIQKMRYLALKLKQIKRLGLSKVSKKNILMAYSDLQNDLTATALAPTAHRDREKALDWSLYFLKLFPAMHQYLNSLKNKQKILPVFSKQEQDLLSQFLNHYLIYRFATMNYRYSDGSIIFFQIYFLLALHLCMLQLLAAFYRDKDGLELNQEHLLRAANLVGYRFEHSPKFVAQHHINKLSPTDSLEGMEVLLHFDLCSG